MQPQTARCMSQGNIELMPKKQVFDFKLAPDKNVWPLLRVTLRPDGGMPLTIRSKDAAA